MSDWSPPPQDPDHAPPPPPAGPPPPPPAYPPPPSGYPPYPPYGYQPRIYNGLAITSLVLGIVWIYWIGSILALIFGYIAKRQIRERNELGSGMATAGIVLGWVGVGTLTLMIVLIAVDVLSGDTT